MKSSTARKSGKQNIEERRAEVFKQRLLIGIVLGVIALYLFIAVFYAFHFEPRSHINGIDVSGLSLKKARAKLTEVAEDYVLTISSPGQEDVDIAGTDIGLSVADAANARSCLRAQPKLGWLFALLREKSYTVDLSCTYDEEALTERMASMAALDEEAMIRPVDAYLTEDETGAYVIVPEEMGTTLRTEEAKEIIRTAAGNARRTADLQDALITPTLYQDDPSLLTRREEWNTYLQASGLTYRVGDAEEVLDGTVIASLLEDDGEHVTLSYAKTADLMAEWRKAHDTYHHSFDFTTAGGREVRIQPYGDYGFELDEESTCSDVMDKINAHDTGTYDAFYYHEAPYRENHGLGGNYVEISINAQHLWVWKDGEVVVDTEVVTGLPIHGSVTYHGCYAIKSKQTDVTLGELDVQGYESPVSYWIPFNGGEGMHDAPWREYFGGRIWITNGSHGCVNVPEWVMDDIFEQVEVGEAVVIYGSEYDDSVNEIGSKVVNEEYYYDVFYGGDD